MTGNLSGIPSRNIALVYWTSFAFERITMLCL
jgi:hypothetical protein